MTDIITGNRAKAADFIYKSQANVVPSVDAGRVPKLETTGRLHKDFLTTDHLLIGGRTYEEVDASALPKPMAIAGDGTLVLADANAADDNFVGFINVDLSAIVKTANRLNNVDGGSLLTYSHLAPAGNDRVIFFAWNGSANTNPTPPTSVTWNSIAMTLVENASSTYADSSLWVLAIGDSVSDETHDIVLSGGSAPEGIDVHSFTYENVDQITPTQASANSSGVSGTYTDAALTKTQGLQKSLLVVGARGGTGVVNTGTTLYNDTDGTPHVVIVEGSGYIGETLSSVSFSGSNSEAGCVCLIKNATLAAADNVEFYQKGKLGGFSGLTIASMYYVSNTRGAISTSAGTTSLPVGRAISATEILII